MRKQKKKKKENFGTNYVSIITRATKNVENYFFSCF